ncbi:MAG TPA: hypothetical protein VLN47_04595 [Clostridiaceae bacterium]|nr:hypothetical protein [Clostridiaceae bacterium]
MREKRTRLLILSLFSLYLLVNLLTLTRFPAVHSDELWLKGLTDEMLARKTFVVTEPFYDLYPRIVHPFRWLFHTLQAFVFFLFGSTVFSIRLLSLGASAGSLLLFYSLIKTLLGERSLAFAAAAALALNIQFIYSAHFGRQEALILFLLLLSLTLCIRKNWRYPLLSAVLPALVILAALGTHPNAFLIALTTGAVFLVQALQKKRPLRDLFILIGTVSAGALLYLSIGFHWNPDLITGYLRFGSSVGVDASLTGRTEGFYWFWYKLFERIGGTYDLFDLRIELILGMLFLIALIVFSLQSIRKRTTQDSMFLLPFTVIGSLLFGIFLIGRYNQTSVVFLLPFLILSGFTLAHPLFHMDGRQKLQKPVLLILLAASIFGLYGNLTLYREERPYQVSYDAMLDQIGEIVPRDAVVLGNLNLIGAFRQDRFYDVRNLGHLSDADITFEGYVEARGIEYILVHDEMAYIDDTSPKWDFLYVNNDFSADMRTFLETRTDLVDTVANPIYAMRIARYSGTYPWETKIYRVR